MTTIPTTIQERVPLPVVGAAPPPAAKAITSADLISMAKQRSLSIIIFFLLFAAIGVGLFFLAYFKYPLYQASALIECISDAPPVPMSVDQPKLLEDPFLRFIESQALFIKSYPILSTVLTDTEVREDTSWYDNTEPGQHLIRLEKELSCGPVRDTNYIRVSLSTRSPEDPHKIVNTVVTTYLSEVRDRYSQPYRQELSDYKREQASLRDQIYGDGGKQEEIRRFIATLPPGELTTDVARLGQGAIFEKLKRDQEKVSDYELQTAELKSLLDIYSDPSGQAVTPEDKLIVEQDPRVAMLDSQVFQLEQELNILGEQLGPNHREHDDMETRRDEAMRQLEAARSNRLQEVIEYKREQIRTAYYNSQNALMLARDSLQETQAQQADLERKLSEYKRLLDEQDILVEMYNRLDEYIQEIERIVRKRAAVRVESAVAASKPLQRSFPSLILLPVAVFAAFALAVGLGIGLELMDTSVKSPQDIIRHLNIPLLGSIPDVDDEEMDIERVETAVREAPQSMVTEAFRTVRSNLQFSAPAERMRTILVTSPKPEDGRTTIAANLAASMAASGRRVLLVDVNFRRPALQRIYDQIGGEGMTNILIGDAELADCIHQTDLANLDVIGSGPTPPNPAELLGSDLCRRFVVEASERYNHILFDAPPVLLASDASVLATLVDGTIVVCRAMDNTRGVAQRACSLLTHVNAHIFGAVLNVARARRGGYFREQLRTFYEYQSEEDELASRPPALPPADKGADPDAPLPAKPDEPRNGADDGQVA